PILPERELLQVAFGPGLNVASIKKLREAAYESMLEQAEARLNSAADAFLPSGMRVRFRLRAVEGNRTRVAVTLVDRHRARVTPALQGAGMRRLLTLLGVLIARRTTNSGHLYLLFDEPETSLHADAQHYLRATLESIAEDKYIQVVYATHSPCMIN